MNVVNPVNAARDENTSFEACKKMILGRQGKLFVAGHIIPYRPRFPGEPGAVGSQAKRTKCSGRIEQLPSGDMSAPLISVSVLRVNLIQQPQRSSLKQLRATSGPIPPAGHGCEHEERLCIAKKLAKLSALSLLKKVLSIFKSLALEDLRLFCLA